LSGDLPALPSAAYEGRERGRAMMVYLLHFHQKLAHSQRYIGFTTNLDKRLTDHLCGMGARIMDVCFERGIEWELARTWPGDQELERRLKRRHGATSICPL
jgi:predicted GIY-YIG superfamily endonuclease